MTEPPLDLRGRTLRAALSRRAPARPAPGFARPYAATVSMLDVLLADLRDAEWSVAAAPGWDAQEWDARDLVAHLSANDGLLGEAIAGGGSSADDVPARTEEQIGRGLPSLDAWRAWRRQADALCDGLDEADADRRVTMGGITMRLSDHFASRAFETWIHADDIGKATGRALPPPLPEHLHPIADLGARSLPKALSMIGRRHPTGVLRLDLDGPGGGRWTIPLGRTVPDDAPATHLRMDVLEFCFLAGGRRTPACVQAETSGDPDVARDVLAAASAFSGP